MRYSTGRLTLAAITLGAALTATAAPADADARSASDVVRICSNNQLGGQFYCGGPYGETGETYHSYPNGTSELFVIGLNHAVWTRWQANPGGGWVDWYSLGGGLYSRVQTSSPGGWIYSIGAIGGNGRYWFRDRQDNGVWTEWHQSGFIPG